jgi:hypothetical protein
MPRRFTDLIGINALKNFFSLTRHSFLLFTFYFLLACQRASARRAPRTAPHFFRIKNYILNPRLGQIL